MTATGKMLTVRDVAEITGLGRMTVYRLIHNESLRAYRMGRCIRVDSRDLDSYLRSCNTRAWEFKSGSES